MVLIVADDMGYGDFGVFNNGLVRTPNLDQLVAEGLCLTQHYSASPVCSPARAALLTGRYPHRTGAITPQEVLGLDRIALDE
jgi:arylsulfatase A